jgi:hypothetical protein
MMQAARRIIGITKEVDMKVSVTRSDGGQNTGDEEMFRSGDVIRWQEVLGIHLDF